MKIGIKQFSNQLESYKDDILAFKKENLFDYLELFVFPGQMEYLDGWLELKRKHDIKFTIHAPHFSQGCNLADKDKLHYNEMVYMQVNTYAKSLDAEYTVVHGGMDGSVEEIVRQLNIIKPYKMRIENKPYVAPRNPDKMVCRGATPEEIEYIMQNCKCEFNLDIGHAFCSAVSQGFNQFEYLERFLKLNPKSYHLSDGEFNNRIDIHYHLKDGDYDWDKIFKVLNKNLNWTLETLTKKNTDGLKFVRNDIEIIKRF